MLKKITLSADEILIQQAHHKASLEHTTLNELFQKWLVCYVSNSIEEYATQMEHLAYVQAKAPYTREEMNERRPL